MIDTNSTKRKNIYIDTDLYEEFAKMVASELAAIMAEEDTEWVKGLDWVCQQTGGSKNWVRDKILYPFRHELEGIVEYPENQGQHWRFNKHHVKQWLRNKNFKELK